MSTAKAFLAAAMLLMFVLEPVRASAATPADAARERLAAQVSAWNRGDLEAALSTYLDDPSMTWVSVQGVARGFAPFAADMRAQFGSKPDQMGTYSAEVLEARSLSPRSALLVVRWRIDRDGKKLFGGVSTQLWERRSARWLCVLEHAT